MQAEHAFLRLARQIKRLECPICGLWPIRGFWSIGASAIPQNVPVDLAKALASLGGSTGIIVRQQDWQDGPPDAMPSIEIISDGVAFMRPIQARSGVGATLERVLPIARDRYSQVLLDLSGFNIVSLTEVALLPGVGIVLLMAPGATSDLALAKLRRRLPSERILGAVLVEPEPRKSATQTRESQGR
jgi:hypothetical protein